MHQGSCPYPGFLSLTGSCLLGTTRQPQASPVSICSQQSLPLPTEPRDRAVQAEDPCSTLQQISCLPPPLHSPGKTCGKTFFGTGFLPQLCCKPPFCPTAPPYSVRPFFPISLLKSQLHETTLLSCWSRCSTPKT